MATVLHWITQHGYFGLFGLLVSGIVGLPVPDEVVLICAGALVEQGDLRPVPTLVSALAGSLCGMTLSYSFGRTLGLVLLQKYGSLVHLNADRLAQLQQWYGRWGKWAVLGGYFLPGVRHLTAYLAGMSKLSLPVFALFASTGALLWSVTFLLVGYLAGGHWQAVAEALRHHLRLATGIILLLGMGYWVVRRRYRHRL